MKMTKEELSIRKREQMHGPILISLRLLRWVGEGYGCRGGVGRVEGCTCIFRLSITVFSGTSLRYFNSRKVSLQIKELKGRIRIPPTQSPEGQKGEGLTLCV